jgi:ABC-type transport system substrate-binding protein
MQLRITRLDAHPPRGTLRRRRNPLGSPAIVAALLIFGCLALVCAASMGAATRPHYGATVHILLQHKIGDIDPLVDGDYPDERDKLSRLVFETLTQIDGQGRLRPQLASTWHSEAGNRVWQFQLRLVNFQDGSAVTAGAVAGILRAANPEWKIGTPNRQTFTIETPTPVPHLPELLALQKFAIVKRQSDNMLVGTGPYRLNQWQSGEHALFAANEDYWGGRPYPDAIEVRMGASLREHLLERSLGREHAAQLGLDQAHGLEQTTQNVVYSRPAELLAIVFVQSEHDLRGDRRKPVDPHIREALSLALNRQAIGNVLLQRKAAAAGALLPQWLTGYEFLLSDRADLEQAHKLRSEAGTVPPVTLAYDFGDSVSKLVAERIAVDAREAGIIVQPFGDAHIGTKAGRKTLNADAVLLRVPLAAPVPSAALAGIADVLDLAPEMLTDILSAERPDDLFSAERKILENYKVIPVVHLSQALWLNTGVHNWQQLPDGEWNLEQMWVEK